MAQLLAAPTIGIIDEQGKITLQWNPIPVNGNQSDYSEYDYWKIYLSMGSVPTEYKSLSGTYSFEGQLPDPTQNYTLNMTAIPTADAQSKGFTDSPAWSSTHSFPDYISASQITLDNDNPDKAEAITINFPSNYTSGSTAWRVLYQDGSVTNWMPTSVKAVAKSFSDAGQQTITIEVQNDFSLNAPAVQLRRQAQLTILVNNQVHPSAKQTTVTGTLGVAGKQGFELVGLNGTTATRAPYEVITRGIVRDTITNELKMLVTTSRHASASSLLGTMAADVFPIAGRPHNKELLKVAPVLSRTDSTADTALTVTAPTLGTFYVGRLIPAGTTLGGYDPVNKTWAFVSGGTPPYAWYADNLPTGMKLSLDGTLSGTPMEMGQFTVNFSIKDSSNPEFITTETLTLSVETDLHIVADDGSIKGNVTLSTAKVGQSYTGSTLLASGGVPPYTWSMVTPWTYGTGKTADIGLAVTTDGVLTGIPSTYNSKDDYNRVFQATIQVTDAIGATASRLFKVTVQPAELAVGAVDQQTIYAGEKFRLAAPIFGGQSPYKILNSSNGIETNVAIIDGRIEFDVQATDDKVGTHTLTLFLQDSLGHSISPSLLYTVAPNPGAVHMTGANFDHVWFDGDNGASHVNLDGLTNLGLAVDPDQQAPSNGLHVNLSGTDVSISGPPTSYGNAEVPISLALMLSDAQIGTVTREYTLLSFDNQSGTTVKTRPYYLNEAVGLNPLKPFFNSGSFQKTGLYPWAATTSYAAGARIIDSNGNVQTVVTSGSSGSSAPTWSLDVSGTTTDGAVVWRNSGIITSRVQTGSKLPAGLSLDATTGLIYGTVTGTWDTSIVEYVLNGVVVGVCTIQWDIVSNDNNISEGVGSEAIGAAQLQVPYTGAIISAQPLKSIKIHGNRRLPEGLTLETITSPTSKVTITGTPVEAGYFDLWFEATDINDETSFLYKRLLVKYATPLAIVTGTLESGLTNVPYSAQLVAFGGVPGYTWQVTGLPTGLAVNSGTGEISGTTTAPDKSSWPLNVRLTDSRGVYVTKSITFTIDNTLRILTKSLPLAAIGSEYSFAIVARGGTPPYSSWVANFVGGGSWPDGWPAPTDNPPPFDTVNGVLEGITSDTPKNATYDQQISFTVTDSTNTTSAPKVLELKTGPGTGMFIDDSGLGAIPRGQQYLGTLKVGNAPSNATFGSWAVSPLSPNKLPGGLALDANSGVISGNTLAGRPWVGTTAFAAGDIVSQGGHYYKCLSNNTGTAVSNTGVWKDLGTTIQVGVHCVDNSGNLISGYVDLTSYSALAITSVAMSSGAVTAPYHFVPTATGDPLTLAVSRVWSIVGGTLPSGINMNASTGEFYGSTGAAYNGTITLQVVDVIGDVATKQFSLVIQNTDLKFVTGGTLPGGRAGVAYSTTLQASGGRPPYSWVIVQNRLPSILGIDKAGVISGTPTELGTFNFVVELTDSQGAWCDGSFSLTVLPNTTLKAGPDYADGTNRGYIGYLPLGVRNTDSVQSRAGNMAFYIVASGITSTSTGQIKLTSSDTNVRGNVESLSNGTAVIRLTGDWNNECGSLNPSTMTFYLNDNGIPNSASFAVGVYDPGSPVFRQGGGGAVSTLPILEGTAGNVYISNNSGIDFSLPTIAGQGLDGQAALSSLFRISGSNTTYQNALYLRWDGGSKYLLGYDGSRQFDSYVDTTRVTVAVKNIAWYNSANKSFDTYSNDGGVGIDVQYLTSPGVASITNGSSLLADGQSQTVVVNLNKPISPYQQGRNSSNSLSWSFSTSGSSGNIVTGVSANYDGSGWLTGWTVTVKPPVSSSPLSLDFNLSLTGNLTYMSGANLVTQNVTYISGKIGSLWAGAALTYPTQYYNGILGPWSSFPIEEVGGYTTPEAAYDGSQSSQSYAYTAHRSSNHSCMWTGFSNPPGYTKTTVPVLYVLSTVGVTESGIFAGEASFWYACPELGSTSNWRCLYDRFTYSVWTWDSVALPAGTDLTQLWVMAKMVAHDNASHYIHEIYVVV
jgi:hypothetical protein